MNAASLLADLIEAIPSLFEWLLALLIFGLLPLSCFARTRPAAAIGFILLSPLFVILLWISSAVSVYAYWGLAGLLRSALFAVIGVIPAALIATLFNGTWTEMLGLMVMLVTTVYAGIAAITLNRRD